jgi:hypothetical protein
MNSKFLFGVLAALLFVSSTVRARDPADDTALLTTLGYTTGQSLLLTHMAIGTLADAFKAKTYRSGEATDFVTTYITVTEGMKEQLNNLLEAHALNKQDSHFIESTVGVLDLVLKEGNALKEFLGSGDDDDLLAYDQARKKALKEIKSLLSTKD